MLLTVEHFQFFAKEFLPGTPDGRTVFDLRADISNISNFFNIVDTGLYISFDKSKNVLCSLCFLVYCHLGCSFDGHIVKSC